MNVTSFQFFGLLLASLVLYGYAPNQKWRGHALIAINVLYLAGFITTPLSILPLIAFAVLGYGLIYLSYARPAWPPWASITIIIALFVYLKRYTVIPHAWQLDAAYVTVGISYILFRILHLIVDLSSRDIPHPIRFKDYFVYVFFFLSFMSGPIQLYQDFEKQIANPKKPDDTEARSALARFATGYVKVLVIAPLLIQFFNHLHDIASTPGQGKILKFLPAFLGHQFVNSHGQYILSSIGEYAAAVALYTFYLYHNFSGYMDIVIGVGRLLGITLPENFNHPFRAVNLMDFWARWHMTLSNWFKIYVFNPTFKAASTQLPSPSLAPYIAPPVFFLSFFLMGVWHGSTALFIFYGLYWGLGVSINQTYQIFMRRKLGKAQYISLSKNGAYSALTRASTFVYFSLSLTCFWMPRSDYKYLRGYLELKGIILLIVTLGVIALMIAFADYIRKKAEQLMAKHGAYFTSTHFETMATASKLLLVAYVFVLNGSQAPEFVYRAF